MDSLKKCATCGLNKSPGDYYKSGGNKCKSCWKEYFSKLKKKKEEKQQ